MFLFNKATNETCNKYDTKMLQQESVAKAKVSARQQCMYEEP